MCKPSLSRTLVCAAARLCQTLGYHRISTMANDTKADRDRKIMLYWLVYALDRNLSLRLGHAPAIQDYEISLPKLEASEIFPGPIVSLINHLTDVSRIQGQACEQLYSPAALTQPNDIRAQRARILADDLRQVYEVKEEVSVPVPLFDNV